MALIKWRGTHKKSEQLSFILIYYLQGIIFLLGWGLGWERRWGGGMRGGVCVREGGPQGFGDSWHERGRGRWEMERWKTRKRQCDEHVWNDDGFYDNYLFKAPGMILYENIRIKLKSVATAEKRVPHSWLRPSAVSSHLTMIKWFQCLIG